MDLPFDRNEQLWVLIEPELYGSLHAEYTAAIDAATEHLDCAPYRFALLTPQYSSAIRARAWRQVCGELVARVPLGYLEASHRHSTVQQLAQLEEWQLPVARRAMRLDVLFAAQSHLVARGRPRYTQEPAWCQVAVWFAATAELCSYTAEQLRVEDRSALIANLRLVHSSAMHTFVIRRHSIETRHLPKILSAWAHEVDPTLGAVIDLELLVNSTSSAMEDYIRRIREFRRPASGPA